MKKGKRNMEKWKRALAFMLASVLFVSGLHGTYSASAEGGLDVDFTDIGGAPGSTELVSPMNVETTTNPEGETPATNPEDETSVTNQEGVTPTTVPESTGQQSSADNESEFTSQENTAATPTTAPEQTGPAVLAYEDLAMTVEVTELTAGNIPAGSYISFEAIPADNADYIEAVETLNDKAAENNEIKSLLAYKYTVKDTQGTELDIPVNVKVTYLSPEEMINTDLTQAEVKAVSWKRDEAQEFVLTDLNAGFELKESKAIETAEFRMDKPGVFAFGWEAAKPAPEKETEPETTPEQGTEQGTPTTPEVTGTPEEGTGQETTTTPEVTGTPEQETGTDTTPAPETEKEKEIVLTADEVNIRTAPSLASGAINTENAGFKLLLLGMEQDEEGTWWYKVLYGEQDAYVRTDMAKPVTEETPEKDPSGTEGNNGQEDSSGTEGNNEQEDPSGTEGNNDQKDPSGTEGNNGQENSSGTDGNNQDDKEETEGNTENDNKENGNEENGEEQAPQITKIKITAESAVVYTEASTESPELGTALMDESFELVETITEEGTEEAAWYAILYKEGKGYVEAANAVVVEITSEEESDKEETPEDETATQKSQIKITAESAVVYTEASTESPELGTALKEESFELIETLTNEETGEAIWYKILYQEAEGYVEEAAAEIVEQEKGKLKFAETVTDDGVTVTVTELVEGAIPENAKLYAIPIKAEQDQEKYDKVDAQIQEAAVEKEYEILGFLAYDIFFTDAEGNKIEPNGEVMVSMAYEEAAAPDTIPEEEIKEADVTMLQFEEDKNGQVNNIVDMKESNQVETLSTNEETNKVEAVEVKTESFSTYALIWVNQKVSLEINVIDKDGKPIGNNNEKIPIVFNNNTQYKEKSVEECAPKINGYKFGLAYVNDEQWIKDHGKITKICYWPKNYLPNRGDTVFQLKTEKDNVEGTYRLKETDEVYFIYGPDSLTLIQTVSHTEKGITMKMQNLNGDNYYIGLNSNSRIDLGGGYGDGTIKKGLLKRNLKDDFPVSVTAKKSIAELFANGTSVDYLFSEDTYKSTGYLEYSSFENYAYLNGNDFTVYEELGTPNNRYWYPYQRGNFMPYNKIEPGKLSTNRNLYNENGNLLAATDPDKGEVLYKTVGTNDYHFGMYMQAMFLQPQKGLIQNGSAMKYEFNGDDDLWVYIDNMLVLDIGGIHDAHSGYIDFSTGEVGVWDCTTGGNPTLSTTTIKKQFREAYKEKGWTEDQINTELDKHFNAGKDTFKDLTTHDFKMFYMERGGSASNLHVKFNLQTIPEKSIRVQKKLGNTDQEKYEDKDFEFQVYVQKDGDDSPVILDQNAMNIQGITANLNGVSQLNIDEEGTFKLKAGQYAEFLNIPVNWQYYVKEVNINKNEYDSVQIDSTRVDQTVIKNEEEVDVEGEEQVNPIGYVQSTMSSVGERPVVTFWNRCTERYMNELKITKKMDNAPDNAEFKFEVSLTDQNGILTPYANGDYYLQDEHGDYYYLENESLVKNDPTEDNPTGAVVCGKTDADGIIKKVRVGDTISIVGLTAGTGFTVEEIGLSEDYNEPVIEVEEGTAAEAPDPDKGTLGAIRNDGIDAVVTVTNRMKDSLIVKKTWNSLNGTGTPVMVGLYKKSGTDGSELTAAADVAPVELSEDNEWSYTFTGYDIKEYTVRELIQVEDRNEAEFTVNADDGKSIYYKAVDDNGTITVDSNKYQVTYDEDSEVGTVTINNTQKWQIVKKSSSLGSNNQILKLPDAEFTLTNTEDTAVSYSGQTGSDGVVKWKDSNQTLVDILPDGKYTLKETKAPKGYVLSSEEWTIEVSNGIPVKVTSQSKEKTSEVVEGIATFYYENTAVYDLPSSGGNGIYWYTISGMLFMMAAALILYKNKCREVAKK